MTIALTQEYADSILAYLREQLNEENERYESWKADARKLNAETDPKLKALNQFLMVGLGTNAIIERHHEKQVRELSRFIELLIIGSKETQA